MGYIVEIHEGKLDKMSGYAEEMLRAGGKLMSCLEELSEGGYGERGGYGMRGGSEGYDRYGMRGRSGHTGRMGYRDDDDDDDMGQMGERRRRRANGRFY